MLGDAPDIVRCIGSKRTRSGSMPKFSEDNAAEYGALGGIRSGEVRRAKRSMRESMRMILELPMVDGDKQSEFTSYSQLIHANPSMRDAMMAGLAKRAIEQGDPNAVRLVREIEGNDTSDDSDGRDHELAPLIIEKFYKTVHYEMLTRRSRDLWLKGGRGSTKSSWAAFEIIADLEAHPTHCAAVFRKVQNTLRDSCYAQLQFALNMMGLSEDYDCRVSPMQITRRDTGQVIVFRGCDDPKKAKGITLPDPKMHIAVAWFEEVDQFGGMDEIRSLIQTVSRGGDDFVRIYTYNPPRSRDSWVNKEIQNEDGKYVSSSTYQDVPPAWLGQQFIDDAETLREWNEDAYRHEYLGEPVGYGAQVFENLDIRPISDEEIASCNAFYNGVDWGYHPDPWVFIRVGVQHAQRTIYIIQERTGTRLSNEDTARIILDALSDCNRPERELVTCDSAEPKSIEEYRRLGVYATACTKYPGCVETGMKALAGEWHIVIDPARCPLAAEEFGAYEFDRLSDGTVISRYPDKDNHTIDAVRYALEVELIRKGS